MTKIFARGAAKVQCGLLVGERGQRIGNSILALALLPTLVLAAAAQVTPASQKMVTIIVRPEGADQPLNIEGPNGVPLEKKGANFQVSVAPPQTGITAYDLAVNYSFGSYPLRIRLHPLSQDMHVAIGIARPKSCADVYLKPLERPTPTQTASVRAAFTLGYMIDGRAGPNSCDRWLFRAAKARFDRYYNAMERSGTLLMPDGVKEALRLAATTPRDKKSADELLASIELAEKQRLAVSLQGNVLAAVASRDFATAHATSEVLLDTASRPDFAAAVASQITFEALEKQTRDLGERAASERQAEVAPEFR